MNEIYSPYVWCGTCCLRTRECDSKAEAIIAWNTRVPTPSDHAGWQDALTGCVGIESNGGNGGHPWVRVSFTEPGQEVALHYSLLAELIPTPPILTAGSGEGA
ncbi:hypothetical protein [Novosphingobium sp. Leaf2]|uniref:hypothetical protein n=1 Tax=Novosphingobium sp. Leaf2 TaxID=1735670 RepID=UPI001F26F295|nr:hypothetical protein [Novosphingobium sp. Leaf2]